MAFTTLTIEQVASGRKESVPAVTITEQGRIVFSAAISKTAISDSASLIKVMVDKDNRQIGLVPLDAPEKGKEAKDYLTIARPKKGKNNLSAGFRGVLAGLNKAGIAYDEKTVGNQTYSAKVQSLAKGAGIVIVFTLPENPTRKPKAERKPRKAKTAPATSTEAPKPTTAPATDDFSIDESEIAA